MYCKCDDWKNAVEDYTNLFIKTEDYGFILSWIELSVEKNHHQINKYGIKIKYCPFCGNILNINGE